jgi:cobyrinic acid a,c-diamide synthase
MAAYRDRRLRVQPFKVGPDFINSGFHARITEPASRHLDGWMLGGAFNHVLLQRLSRPRDGVIVEGVAGLDDVAARRQSQGARHHERAGCERSG